MKVLVVDPDSDICMTLVDALRDVGHAADCATTLNQAQHYLDAVKYDVVFIDHWMLKTQNRYDILNNVRGSAVVISTLARPEKELRGVKYHRLLKKPFTLEELINVLG